MSIRQTDDPDIMEQRSGGGMLMLFGLPFLLGGCMVIAASLGLVGSKGNPPPLAVAIPFGGIFMTVGIAFIFGRNGIIINMREGMIQTWWGLLVPVSRKEYRIAEFDRVTIKREVRRSKNSSYTVFPVHIEGEGNTKVKFEEPQDFTRARNLAEEIAKFVRLPVHDSTSGSLAVRDADHLDESLREQVQRTGEKIALPQTPDNLKSTITPRGSSVTIEIPPSGFNIIHKLQMAMGAIIPVVIIFMFIIPLMRENMPAVMKLGIFGFLSIFFIGAPLLIMFVSVLSAARTRFTITVSPAELRVEEFGLRSSKVTLIPANELEELTIGIPQNSSPQMALLIGKRIIIARSDRATVQFGGAVSSAEIQYIHALIKAVITA